MAVDGIDLEVAEGEIYGFLGPNGAGKSTTVRMLTTLLLPTGGTATVAGFDVRDKAEMVRLRIGVALQEAALDPSRPARAPRSARSAVRAQRRAATSADCRALILIDIGARSTTASAPTPAG